MRCLDCRRIINSSDAKNAVRLKDDEGRVQGVIHFKCSMIRKRHERMRGRGKWRDESPSVYTEAMSRKSRDDLSPAELERIEQAESRYAELRARVKSGDATGEEKTELGDLATARDGEELDMDALELTGAEEKAREAQATVSREREKEAAPTTWDDWRGPESAEL